MKYFIYKKNLKDFKLQILNINAYGKVAEYKSNICIHTEFLYITIWK